MEKFKIKCPHCGYEWRTKSTMVLVSCSSCGRKIKNQNKKDKDLISN